MNILNTISQVFCPIRLMSILSLSCVQPLSVPSLMSSWGNSDLHHQIPGFLSLPWQPQQHWSNSSVSGGRQFVSAAGESRTSDLRKWRPYFLQGIEYSKYSFFVGLLLILCRTTVIKMLLKYHVVFILVVVLR